MSSRKSIWMQRIGVGACPVLALLGVRVWLASNGPASAGAATISEPIVAPEFKALPMASEAHQRLIERARALETVEASSPFPRNEAALIAMPDMVPLPGEPEPRIEPPPELTLTSVMGGRVPVALVNGRPRSVGDLVAPDWSIVEIGQDSIVVAHPDGRQTTVRLQRGTP